MSEEQEGGWSGLKKTVIGIGGTVATAVGLWVTTQVNTILGVEDEESTTEQVAPVQSNQQSVNVSGPAITINVPEQQKAAPSHTTVIKETVREVPAAQPAPAPVEEKKETTAERIARLKKEKAERDGASN
jgi:hypothetical protein